MRRFNVFLNKDLIPQYIFYKKLIKLFYTKNKFISNLFVKNNNYNNFYIVFPAFFLKKKIFGLLTLFKDFIFKNNLNYFFLNKQYKGNNVFLFNQSNSLINLKLFDEEENLKLLMYKHFFINSNYNIYENFNFFFNFNLYINNLVEIYRIIIIIYFNKLK